MKVDYSQRVFGLDVMRAAAILFVVCSHALWVFPEEEIAFSSLLRFSGYIGVEIFFVLSGFLIGRIMLRIFSNEKYHHKDLGYFLVRRWFRTLPNYYLVLCLNILIVLYIGRELPQSLWSYFFFLQNFSSGMDIFFTESWSLPIEEFAYIIGPICLILTTLPKTNINRDKRFFWVTLFIIIFFIATKIVFNLSHEIPTMDIWNIELKAVVLYRIDAIYYGVLAAYISVKATKIWKKYKMELFLIGFVLFILLHLAIARFGLTLENTPFLFNVMYLPLCSVTIACFLPLFSEWKTAPPYLLKPITFISLISYSMYLLHYSIILQLMRFEIVVNPESIMYQVIFSLGYLFITIVLSYLLFKFYERPLMNLRDHTFFQKFFKLE